MSRPDPPASPPSAAGWGWIGGLLDRLDACGADRQRLAQTSLAAALELVGGGQGACWLLADGSTVLERCTDPATVKPTAPLAGGAPVALAVRSGRVAADDGSLVVPLVGQGGALGALELWPGQAPASPAAIASLTSLARLCSGAIERAALGRAALASPPAPAGRGVEANQDMLRFLAEAARLLASSLDLPATLEAAARLSVPRLGDWCFADLIEHDGTINRLGVAHADTDDAAIALAARARRTYAPRHDIAVGVSIAASTRKAQLITRVDDALLDSLARDEDHLSLLRALGIRSMLMVPLVARDRVVGAMSFVWARSARQYGPDDLALAEQLAQRVALAVDNARLYRETQEASQLKDEFLATISHELRTPLNAVLGWSQLLRDRPDDPAAVRRGLDIIQRNALAQARLIEDVLDVSRIITGRLRLEPRPVDVAQVMRAAVDAIGPAAQAKGIALRASIEERLGLIDGDPDRLQQIVWNLASNAVKFTPQGGEVTISAEREAGGVVLSIRDSGAGIEPSFLPHVFERFRQADSSTTRRHGGLGLGLAIARHLVELHGGTIAVESPGPGLGTTFTVVLPAGSGLPRAPEAAAPRTSSSPDLAPPPVGLSELRVLVVDDEPDGRELVAAMLEAAGAEVLVATSAAEGLALLEQQRPDVLVSDIAMPGEDGYALIRRVRALGGERGGRTPAVALTAHAREEDARRAFAAGFQMHVPKPVDRTALLAVVANLGGRTSEP